MDDTLPCPSPVSALRDTFGDRKPPEISRKITACVACRKQKVKCHMRDGDAPCLRCKKRGLSCTVNRSLQMLLEEDVTWKNAVSQKLRRLEDTMHKFAVKLEMPLVAGEETSSPASVDISHRPSYPNDDASNHPEQTWEVVVDPNSGPASIPASCVPEVRNSTSLASTSPRSPVDLISRGAISLQDALSLFEVYHQRLDHFLYRILGDHNCLDSVRASSPLLTAAILTVGALHSPSLGHLFERCSREFKTLVAEQTFSNQHNIDDVRGLCIGAFWLSELSWALVGTAVRIAAEINLHAGIYKALKGDREAYMQTRVYYLVYVCDRHFSVAYGRPPMSRQCNTIDAADRFLKTENATEDDARLVSQVKIWLISGQVFDTFGVDTDTPISAQLLPQLRRFSISLDTWYVDWSEHFAPNKNVGNYPKKGVDLHFHFAKLYQCSHAFRGISTSQHDPQGLTLEMEDIANTGVLSAISILRLIVSDIELQSYLNGLPLYFDTMIAFTVVFLLKMATKYSATIRIDTNKILFLVDQMAAVLQDITHTMHRQHPLVCITDGLGKLLKKCQDSTQSAQEPSVNLSSTGEQLENYSSDIGWMESMSNFDFLNLRSNFSNLEDWSFDFDCPHPPR